MRYRLHQLAVSYNRDTHTELRRCIEHRLGDRADLLSDFQIIRRSIDARPRPVNVVYSVDIELSEVIDGDLYGAVEPRVFMPLEVQPGDESLAYPPVVIGGGPAGLFAALLLAEHGYSPILLERGGDVRQYPVVSGSDGHFSRSRSCHSISCCNACIGVS